MTGGGGIISGDSCSVEAEESFQQDFCRSERSSPRHSYPGKLQQHLTQISERPLSVWKGQPEGGWKWGAAPRHPHPEPAQASLVRVWARLLSSVYLTTAQSVWGVSVTSSHEA